MNSQSQQVKLVRKFAFAGIAIIWIFKIELPNAPLIPHELILAINFFNCYSLL